MGNTRWGESIDVITDRARLDTLLRYRIVVLANSGPIPADLLADLKEYVQGGGTLVVNVAQRAHWAAKLTARRTLREAPDKFEKLAAELRDGQD